MKLTEKLLIASKAFNDSNVLAPSRVWVLSAAETDEYLEGAKTGLFFDDGKFLGIRLVLSPCPTCGRSSS